MVRFIAVSALVATVTGTVAQPVSSQNKLSFCADAPGVKVPAQLLPVDEAVKQPEFFTFRARLQVAVAARDLEAVVASADPNIKLGFGGEDGVALLRENLSKPTSEGLWKELARILALGGAFTSPASFYAPYVSSNWPDGADSFECGVIIGANVFIRRDPRPDAAVVTRANYAIVRVRGDDVADWERIQLSSGQEGYVRGEYLLGATGLRAMFTLSGGQWRMSSLVAGD